MFAKLVALATLPALALAHRTFTVVVGLNNTLTFTPDQLFAVPGDVVSFQFVSKNHSSTTTTFDTPCPPPAGGVPGGWDSGFNPVLGTPAPPFPTFNVTVKDYEPHFVACRQGNHCNQLMLFALNPTAEMSFAAFSANAAAS